MEVRGEIVIRERRSKVFWFAADGLNAPYWNPLVKHARRLSEHLGPYSKMVYKLRFPRLLVRTEAVYFKPERRYVDRVKIGPLQFYHEGIFLSLKDDSTKVIHVYRFDGRPKSSILRELIRRIVLRYIKRSLANLKRVIEKKAS